MTSILIYNLHPRVTLRDIVNIFNEYGNLEGAELYDNLAKVIYTNFEDAMDAIHDIDGQELDGRQLTVLLGN